MLSQPSVRCLQTPATAPEMPSLKSHLLSWLSIPDTSWVCLYNSKQQIQVRKKNVLLSSQAVKVQV